MEELLRIIDEALKRKGLSDAAASKLAVGNAALLKNMRNRRSDKHGHPFENIAKLIEVLDLELYIGPPRPNSKPEVHTIVGDQDFAALPLVDAEVSAGPGAVNEDPEVSKMLAFRQDWLRKLGVKPAEALLVRVRGDSMAPQLQSGDLALIDRSRSEVVSSRVYAFNDRDGETRIKRLDQPEKGILVLRSDNPDHVVELRRGADLNRLKIIGEVVWSGHTWR